MYMMAKATKRQKRGNPDPSPAEFAAIAEGAFMSVVRKASKNNRILAFSIDGKIVHSDAKKLKAKLADKKSGLTTKEKILQTLRSR